MKIPFYNIDRIYAKYKKEILGATDVIFSGGRVVEGKAVEELEENLKNLTGRKHAFAVNSCTDAIFFSLLAAGVGKGDEVIVPALSFVASATPVVRTGAKAVFADTHSDGNIDLNDAAGKISVKTKAIIPVHLYGKMIDPTFLDLFGKKFNIAVIEDAAQALGSKCGETPAGKTGFCSCFSFDPSKVVGAFGTGGAVMCDDDAAAEKIKMWRSQGRDQGKGLFTQPGYNSRLSTLQAALLNMQIKNLEEIIESRNRIAAKYHAAFSGLPIGLPPLSGSSFTCNFHKFPVTTPHRDELKKHLDENGIETAVHYPYLLPGQPVFGKNKEIFPAASSIAANSLSLPIYPELTEKETDHICKTVVSFFNSL